jgi:hypothetical protein
MGHERELVDLAGTDVSSGAGSKSVFESHVASTPSVHQFNAVGPLGSLLSTDPFQNNGD